MNAMLSSTQHVQTSRRGVTLIELLVSLAVVSLLLAILLPAVLASRERANRARCQDHLRQLALATQEHETAHRLFPYTAQVGFDFRMKLVPAISPHVALLPFLDQGPLERRFDRNDGTPLPQGIPPQSYSSANSELVALTVPVFRCPSDRVHAGGTNYRANFGPDVMAVFNNLETPLGGTGAFVHARALAAAEFRDGLSHTVFYSERVIGDGNPARYDPWRDLFCGNPAIGFRSTAEAVAFCGTQVRANSPHDSWMGHAWIYGGWNHTWYHHALAPNHEIPDCTSACGGVAGGATGLYGARSEHPGGVNIALGDTSVRFVSEQIDLAVWQAISTRNGSETERLE